jgi:hypothetical protein
VILPAASLEREIVELGVAEKQKDKARQVFERSADQAGFFEHGPNRLVMPGIAARHSAKMTSRAMKMLAVGAAATAMATVGTFHRMLTRSLKVF